LDDLAFFELKYMHVIVVEGDPGGFDASVLEKENRDPVALSNIFARLKLLILDERI
jgi:hypothetical protein